MLVFIPDFLFPQNLLLQILFLVFIAGRVFKGLLNEYCVVRYHTLDVVVDDIEFEIALGIGFTYANNQVFIVCLQVVFVRSHVAVSIVEFGDCDLATFGFHGRL